jgi:hypothetical protein
MSDWPYEGATQRERDICTYGLCWCGEPRRGDVVDDPDNPGGKLARIVCYNEADHQLTLSDVLRRNP